MTSNASFTSEEGCVMSDVVLVCLQVSDDLTGIYQGDYNTSTIHETVAMLTMTSLMCLLGINNNNISA